MGLAVSNLSKDYKGFRAVNSITYCFENGVYGLLGVNGAGKTTLMRMLCTLTQPSQGNVTWNGEDIFSMGESYRGLLGYLPQEFGFYPNFSIWDYLMYIASIKGLPATVAKKRAEVLLKQVGLSKQKNKKLKTLSGGMKRRVGIAQAMMNDPKILILDEPTAGLDPNERVRFRNLISELSEHRVVILSTHIVSDVEYIANEILLMKDGQISLSGTADDIIRSMSERVWKVVVPKQAVNLFIHNHKVSNIKTTADYAELRLISADAPTEDAEVQVPTLEDVFLNYFGEKGGEINDEI